MRLIPLAPVALVALAGACADDPFSLDDALGVWDLEQLNGIAVSGEAPTGVPVRQAGGADTTVLPIQSLSVTFSPGSACSWTFDDGISSPVMRSDCGYAVAADGTVTLDVGDLFGAERSLTGTGDQGILRLQDQDTNEFELRKQ